MIKRPAPCFAQLLVVTIVFLSIFVTVVNAVENQAVDSKSRLVRSDRIIAYFDRTSGTPINGGPPILMLTDEEITAIKAAADVRMQKLNFINPMDRVAPSIKKAIDNGATTVSVAVVFNSDATTEDIASVQSMLNDNQLLKSERGILFGTVDVKNISAITNTNHIFLILPAVKRAPANLEGGMTISSDVVYAIGAYTGSGVKVAVNDTGIAQKGLAEHPDLVVDKRVKDQYDFTWLGGRYQANDAIGHGTYVAGIIGGDPTNIYPSVERYRGVAPDCDLYIYKILPDEMLLPSIELYWALEKAAYEEVDVVNNSWTNIYSPGIPLSDYTTDALASDAAVLGMFRCTDCCDKPMTILFPAGNWQAIFGPFFIADPGTAKNVITVGAANDGNSKNDYMENWPQGAPAFFTGIGPVDVANDGFVRIKPDVIAPGHYTTSCWAWYNAGEYYKDLTAFPAEYVNGTSTSVAFVTGAVANMLEAYYNFREWPEMVKARTINRAVDISRDPVWNNCVGLIFTVLGFPYNWAACGGGLVDNYHMIYDQMSAGAATKACCSVINEPCGDIMETLLWVGSQFDWNTPAPLRTHIYDLPELDLFTSRVALNQWDPFYRMKVTMAFSDNPGYPLIADCFNDLSLQVQWYDRITNTWINVDATVFPDIVDYYITNNPFPVVNDDNVEFWIFTPIWNDLDNVIGTPAGEFATRYRVLVTAIPPIIEPNLLGIFNNLPDGLPYSVEASVIYAPPNLEVAATPSTQTVMPETEFTITTVLSNTGYTGAGAWVSLTLPGSGFKLLSADIQRADGELFEYLVAPTFALPIQDPVREITRRGNTYTVFVGEAIACHDRAVVWHLKTDCCDYHEGCNLLQINWSAINWINDTFIDALGNFMFPANTVITGNMNVEVIVTDEAPQTVDITMCPGMNFITLPLAATGINTEAELLASFNASGCNADAIFTFDCAANAFTAWTILDEGASDPVFPGQPFYVNVVGATSCTWSIAGVAPIGIKYDLCDGFNAIGIPVYSTSLTTAANLIASVPNADAAFQYTRTESCLAIPGFNPYYTFSDPSDNFTLKPGYAYWVNCTATGLWTPPNP